jgi:hypothetical protein
VTAAYADPHALARGMSDFSAMPTHALFLGLIYPIVGGNWIRFPT